MGETAEKIDFTENNPGETSNGNSELAAIVRESQEKLASEKIKKPHGRPRGPGFDNSYYARKKYGTGPAPAAQPPPAAAPAEPPAPPIDLTEHLIAPLKMISKLPAMKYGIPELALADDEALACAHSLQQLMNAFAPDLEKMDPKTAAVLGASLTVGAITANKMMIYVEHKQRIVDIKNQETKPPEPAPVTHIEPPVQAKPTESFFPTAQQ